MSAVTPVFSKASFGNYEIKETERTFKSSFQTQIKFYDLAKTASEQNSVSLMAEQVKREGEIERVGSKEREIERGGGARESERKGVNERGE